MGEAFGEALISQTIAPLRELGSEYARAGRTVENGSYMAESTLKRLERW